MKYQIFDQNFFADIGKNAVDIQANIVRSYYVFISFW